MSKNKETLELFLYKNNLQSNSLADIIPNLSNKTIELLLKDLSLLEKNSISKSTEEENFYIFTDGGCKNNGKKNAIAGYSVFFNDDLESNYSQFNCTGLILSNPSNQCAELTAILKCLEIINNNKNLFDKKNIIIVSDSIYSINCITKWSKNWKTNGWKTSKGEIIKNVEVIQKLIELFDSISDFCTVKFKHIFSHTVEPQDKNTLQYFLWYGNNKADQNVNLLLENN